MCKYLNINKFFILGLFWSIGITQSHAQDPYRKQFDEFRNKINQDFQTFKDSIDRDFARTMRENWKAFSNFSTNPAPLAPDPKTPPVYTPGDGKPGQKLPEPETPEPPKSTPDLDPPRPTPPPASPPANQPKRSSLEYFGASLQLANDPALAIAIKKPFKEGIPNAWEALGKSNTTTLIGDLFQARDQYALNDWGLFDLARKFSSKMCPNDLDAQKLLTCFLLNKCGYHARLGFDEQQLYFLLPIRQKIFNHIYYPINELAHYVIPFANENTEPKDLYSYEGNYRRDNRIIDIYLTQAPTFPAKPVTRELNFVYEETKVVFSTSYNQNLIDYFQQIPSAEFAVVMSTPLSDMALRSIAKGLIPHLEGKSKQEQANILLRFVQKAFQYKTDEDQFGREKYFYAEELLHFPFSDCEDRSALFAVLTHRLLGLDVVGIQFPGHMCTAVRFETSFEGDHLEIDGKRYTICDPTYIGADIGMCMPDFKTAKATVVVLSL